MHLVFCMAHLAWTHGLANTPNPFARLLIKVRNLLIVIFCEETNVWSRPIYTIAQYQYCEGLISQISDGISVSFFFSFIYPIQFIRSFWSVQSFWSSPVYFFVKPETTETHIFFFFERKSFHLWRPLLMIALYHQTKTPISF